MSDSRGSPPPSVADASMAATEAEAGAAQPLFVRSEGRYEPLALSPPRASGSSRVDGEVEVEALDLSNDEKGELESTRLLDGET